MEGNIYGGSSHPVGRAINPAFNSSAILSASQNVALSAELSAFNFYAFEACYHASTDGFSGSTFHAGCDGKGPTVVVVRSGERVFGGYAGANWASSNASISSMQAFLFSFHDDAALARTDVAGDSGSAQFGREGFCPQFGACMHVNFCVCE